MLKYGQKVRVIKPGFYEGVEGFLVDITKEGTYYVGFIAPVAGNPYGEFKESELEAIPSEEEIDAVEEAMDRKK